jgi:hypothetical protein
MKIDGAYHVGGKKIILSRPLVDEVRREIAAEEAAAR